MSLEFSEGGMSGRADELAAVVAVEEEDEDGVEGADNDDEEDEVREALGCPAVGFALTGRSWWSVGLAGRSDASVGPGLTLTVVGVAETTSWSSSSCSVGIGRSS